jgi:hypothetical protein
MRDNHGADAGRCRLLGCDAMYRGRRFEWTPNFIEYKNVTPKRQWVYNRLQGGTYTKSVFLINRLFWQWGSKGNMKMKAADTSETPVSIYKNTQHQDLHPKCQGVVYPIRNGEWQNAKWGYPSFGRMICAKQGPCTAFRLHPKFKAVLVHNYVSCHKFVWRVEV